MSTGNDAWISPDFDGDGRSDLSFGPVDTNHDGLTDSVEINTDLIGDAGSDLRLSAGDADHDGAADMALRLDFDGDGKIDLAISAADQNGDWWPDSLEVQTDFNGDNRAELSLRAHDFTGDLMPDIADLKLDLDGDHRDEVDLGVVNIGVPLPVPTDVVETLWADAGTPSDLVAAFPEDAFAQVDSALAGLAAPGFGAEWQIHGSPEADLSLWDMQDEPYSCAVATTGMVLRSLGIEVPESELAAVFRHFGIYDPVAGTRSDLIDEVVNFISAREGLGLSAHEIHHFSEDDLIHMLDAGVRPLVGLDALELYPDNYAIWDRGLERLYELFDSPFAGHAVQVTGIIDAPSGRTVVLNDPGRLDGGALTVSLDRFMNAVEDMGWTAMAVTRSNV